MSIDVKGWFSRWRISGRTLWITGIGLLLIAFVVFVYFGYHFRWEWTGFPQKRLFDWIQILIIPVAVAIGTFALNRAATRRDNAAQREQRVREQTIETRRAEEASLQAYLEYISRMLTDPERPLRRSPRGDNLRMVARAQTLTVLGRLEDGDRKRSVIQFLLEAGLIRGKHPIIDLEDANLQGVYLRETNLQAINFQGANLQGADLRGDELSGAILKGAILKGTILKGATLIGAELVYTHLFEADLEDANLQGADLFGANLQKAKLQKADFLEANLLGANLEGANLHGAILQRAKNLTQNQIEQTIGDEATFLPEGIARPTSWSPRTGESVEEG